MYFCICSEMHSSMKRKSTQGLGLEEKEGQNRIDDRNKKKERGRRKKAKMEIWMERNSEEF